jgi:16S rRNA (cytosine967-C5)-methyltransferase
MVAEVVNLQPNESFLDVCCAPASKFSLINYLVGEPRALFVGGDLHEKRLKMARKTCERVSAKNYRLAVYNAEKSLPFPDESFDAILLDAPCSGTGTIRHNPEIRYFLEESDFAELSNKQLSILENASKALKSGGRLIYSTCSLEREENETVAARFLAENADFRVVTPDLPESYITADGYARTFPTRDRTDGFFISVFSKR